MENDHPPAENHSTRTSTIRSPARKPAARAGPSGCTRVTSQAPLRNSYSKPSDMPARGGARTLSLDPEYPDGRGLPCSAPRSSSHPHPFH